MEFLDHCSVDGEDAIITVDGPSAELRIRVKNGSSFLVEDGTGKVLVGVGGGVLLSGTEINLNAAVLSVPSLPTIDPHQAGRLWNKQGALKISAG